MMKIKRLGIEWGAAYQEATPIRITSSDGSTIEVFETENGGLMVIAPQTATVSVGNFRHEHPTLEIEIEE